MLPRHQRLSRPRDFQRVYRCGRSWAHPLAAIHVTEQAAGRRFGITVSRKVGGAVQRNRVRRRLREILRARSGEWAEGLDAVIVARAPAARAEFRELEAAIVELARRARLEGEPGSGPGARYALPPRAGRTRQAGTARDGSRA